MTRSFLIAAAVLAAAGATSAAHAETQVGSCYQPMVASLNGQVVNGGNTLSCAKGTWSQLGTGSDTGDVNGFVTVYDWEGKTTDNTAKILFRPRKSTECLMNVTQPNKRSETFPSHGCDTDYKTGFYLSVISNSMWHTVSGWVSSTTKEHQFTAVYKRGSEMNKPGDNTLYLVGLFVEDK